MVLSEICAAPRSDAVAERLMRYGSSADANNAESEPGLPLSTPGSISRTSPDP
jgi:hypothetical protein